MQPQSNSVLHRIVLHLAPFIFPSTTASYHLWQKKNIPTAWYSHQLKSCLWQEEIMNRLFYWGACLNVWSFLFGLKKKLWFLLLPIQNDPILCVGLSHKIPQITKRFLNARKIQRRTWLGNAGPTLQMWLSQILIFCFKRFFFSVCCIWTETRLKPKCNLCGHRNF